MLTLHEQIDVHRPVHEAFSYIADFRTTTEWDSTAIAAEKLTPGPVAVGTVFLVTCKMPLGSIDIRYTLTGMDKDRKLVLQGSSRFFDIEDVIEFSPSVAGTHIDYKATFTFKAGLGGIVKHFRKGLDEMGAESLSGMKAALEDNFAAPQLTRKARRADHLVVPGLVRFTRLGYANSRKHWKPISAWQGDSHIVLTGASSGLGRAAAHRLAEMGARLTLVIRNADKADELRNSIVRETGNENVAIELADLSLMSDVDALVQRLLERGETIDVLINNAGALFNERKLTSEGLEQSFALLLLSPYRLTQGLRPLLLKSEDARVVNVVSGGMYSQSLDVDKLQAPVENYSGSVAYARAKRALMVVTEQWAKEWAPDGITVNAMHPGWADTPGVESSLPGFHKLTRKVLRSPDEGADTIVWLAAATEAAKVTGELFLDREPRAKHMLSSTQESAAERERLAAFLAEFPPAGKRRPGRSRKRAAG
tara:strand:+ start:65794 stop:67233 length:1440 start_codon:yes stop_codon:yes gene_type:complete